MPRTVSATEAKNSFGTLIEWVRANRDEVIVESHGTPAVVIVSIEEYESVEQLKERERRRRALEELKTLRERMLARNRDLSPEEAEGLADRFSFLEHLGKLPSV